MSYFYYSNLNRVVSQSVFSRIGQVVQVSHRCSTVVCKYCTIEKPSSFQSCYNNANQIDQKLKWNWNQTDNWFGHSGQTLGSYCADLCKREHLHHGLSQRPNHIHRVTARRCWLCPCSSIHQSKHHADQTDTAWSLGCIFHHTPDVHNECILCELYKRRREHQLVFLYPFLIWVRLKFSFSFCLTILIDLQ